MRTWIFFEGSVHSFAKCVFGKNGYREFLYMRAWISDDEHLFFNESWNDSLYQDLVCFCSPAVAKMSGCSHITIIWWRSNLSRRLLNNSFAYCLSYLSFRHFHFAQRKRYRVINCNCNKRALYCKATIGFREVHNQFPISNIVTVFPCISLIYPMDDFI